MTDPNASPKVPGKVVEAETKDASYVSENWEEIILSSEDEYLDCSSNGPIWKNGKDFAIGWFN